MKKKSLSVADRWLTTFAKCSETIYSDTALYKNLRCNNNNGKNKHTVILKTGRFDNIDSAVIISSVKKTVYTNASLRSKNKASVTTTVTSFLLLKLFSSHIYCIPK